MAFVHFPPGTDIEEVGSDLEGELARYPFFYSYLLMPPELVRIPGLTEVSGWEWIHVVCHQV